MTDVALGGTLLRRLRLAGFLLVIGLLIQAASLFGPTTPGMFFLFALLGTPLVLLGIALYLIAIVTYR
jgi:hypothetical protein